MPYGSGNQTLNISYTQNSTASNVNKHYRDVIQTGIVWGGALSITGGGATVDIAPFILSIQCSTGEVVRVQTTSVVTVTPTAALPYIIYRLTWTNDAANYGTFEVLADDGNFNGNTVYANDIVFGLCGFTGPLVTSLISTNRSYAAYDKNKDLHVGRDAVVVRNATIGAILQCGTNIVLPVDAAPAGPVKGSCYFDSVANKLYVHNGVGWKSTTLT